MSDHPVSSDRGRRLEHQERAYRLQVRGGVEGLIKYTVYGTLLVTLGHLTWPLFRRQTLALKGFIVSSVIFYSTALLRLNLDGIGTFHCYSHSSAVFSALDPRCSSTTASAPAPVSWVLSSSSYLARLVSIPHSVTNSLHPSPIRHHTLCRPPKRSLTCSHLHLLSPLPHSPSAAVTGMVINADNYLLRFESHQRLHENDIRRRARNELAQRGVIATESEIRKWKAEREREEREAAAVETSGRGEE